MSRRKTNSKTEVLKLLKSKGSAMSHDMIDSEIDSFNRATIYRILNRYCEDGILHKIIDETGKQFFALCKTCDQTNHKHNHFHFKCTNCNKVECMEGELNFSLPSRYVVENFNAMLSGSCGKCA